MCCCTRDTYIIKSLNLYYRTGCVIIIKMHFIKENVQIITFSSSIIKYASSHSTEKEKSLIKKKKKKIQHSNDFIFKQKKNVCG